MIKNTLGKDFIKYVSSNIIAMIGMSCYILADTLFISIGIGDSGLAALNICLPMFNIIFSIGMMFGIGGATRFSIARGRGDTQEGNPIFTHTLMLTTVFSLFFVILGASLSPQLARLMGANADTIDLCSPYLRIIMCFAPFFMFNNVLQNFVRNDLSPRLAMIAMLSGNLFNIVFDYVLIFPAGLGIIGAALATAFAPIVSLMILSIHFLRKKIPSAHNAANQNFKCLAKSAQQACPPSSQNCPRQLSCSFSTIC